MNMTDYEETHRNFRLDVPADFNYATHVIDAWAVRAPSKTALIVVDDGADDRSELTFSDLAKGANRVANALSALGIAPGDRIFVMLPRVPEWWTLLLGIFKMGAVAMPATVLCTDRDIEYRINQAEAVAAVTDIEGAAKLEAIKERCPTLKHMIVVDGEASAWSSYAELIGPASESSPPKRATNKDDPLLIFFTSGTVGYPKMVLHTHASYGAAHEITARFWQDLTYDDVHWTVSDTGWAKAGWGMMFGQWILGTTVFSWDQRGKLDPEQALRVLERSGVTTFCAPPTLFRAFVQIDLGRFDFSGVRHFVSAGEPLNPEVMRVWEEASEKSIYEGYGQTETVNLVASYRCLPLKAGSMGKPAPGFEVDIVDEDGNRLGTGQEGQIAVRVDPERPVGLTPGYWRDEEANSRAFRNGWYYTGDRAERDEDGYIWFIGRDDDVIISASYRIGPFEVESALVEHPAVAEAAVVGKPDPERTSIAKAYVILSTGLEPSESLIRELQDHVKRVTAPYKYPREIEFVKELPKTISGKIRRVELRSRAAQEALVSAD